MVEAEDMQKLEEMKRLVLKKVLTREAIERLGRLKLVKPELANQLELYLVQLYQAGKLKTEVGDEQLKMILETLSETRKFNIKR